ncbi:MAG TPA: PilZ domain-containing protein [Verrucomicrobiae bacterium]|nr:PilZ domain-containing protein [Verrucomicrobiae bacterium]
MQVGFSPARRERVRLRHELRKLTYVILDESNGGIVRNLTHDGIAVQAVAPLTVDQQLRVRFELPHARVRLDVQGQVMWATATGECGIQFLNLPAALRRRIDEWIFGNLLESLAFHSPNRGTITETLLGATAEDGLILSPAPVKVIELPSRTERLPANAAQNPTQASIFPETAAAQLDWLSQPLSRRGIAWSVNALAVVAGLLLFVLVFLSVTREPPKWPMEMLAGAAVFVGAFYWAFFKLCAGTSPGEWLARLARPDAEDEEDLSSRFR